MLDTTDRMELGTVDGVPGTEKRARMQRDRARGAVLIDSGFDFQDVGLAVGLEVKRLTRMQAGSVGVLERDLSGLAIREREVIDARFEKRGCQRSRDPRIVGSQRE